MKIKEDDIVFCTVKKIEGTMVFLNIEGGYHGSLVLSEVSAGRIRNLRNYVSPGRKIVCKVLKVLPDNIELSLRRVTAKERNEVLDKHKKERALRSVLKIMGEDADSIILKIKEKWDIGDFLEESRDNLQVLKEFLSPEKAKKLHQIISEKVVKEKKIHREFILKSFSEHGLEDIKEILNIKGADIKYKGSGLFSLSVSAREFKEAEIKLNEIIGIIKENAKRKNAFFEIKKK